MPYYANDNVADDGGEAEFSGLDFVEFGLVMLTTTRTLFTHTWSTADNITLKDVEKNIAVLITFEFIGADDGRCVDTILCGWER